jgi:hypothetical protein
MNQKHNAMQEAWEDWHAGRRAVAVKCVTLAEDHLHDHFPGFAIMPASLMIEGMAQAGSPSQSMGPMPTEPSAWLSQPYRVWNR